MTIMDRRNFIKSSLALALFNDVYAVQPNPPILDSIWNPPKPPTDGPITYKEISKSWKIAMSEIQGGGTIIVAPGLHTTTIDNDYVYTTGWDYLNIVGEYSNNRPLFCMQPNTEGNIINNFLGWSGNNGNLWITNMRFHGSGSNLLACGTGPNFNHKQVVVLDNVELAYSGHHCLMMAYEFAGSLTGSARLAEVNDELWIKDSEIHHSGLTHVHYCDRIAKEVIVNSKFHNGRGISGHALKSIARELIVIDSEISNVNLDGSIDYDNSHWSFGNASPPDFYLGAVPVSIVAGQQGLFKNNLVVHRTDNNFNTGSYCVAQQGRHGIHGLEVPDPLDLAGDFYNPNFWAIAKPWIMRFENNSYIVTGDSTDMPVQKIYQNSGTYPVQTGWPIVPIDAPLEWWERSTPICSGDRIRGFTLRGKDLYASTPYNHDRNPTDDPVGRFTIKDFPIEF